MTDSMNFGPDWIRNLSSDGNTGGGTSGGTRYQLADYRYGREEMLALFDRNIKPPACLTNFKSLYSETTLSPLALLPTTDEERGGWQPRPTNLGGVPRGRGGSLERGARGGRGRGTYQSYTRPANYDGWGNGEPSDWSPRKEYSARATSMDNWRRARNNEEDERWRPTGGRGGHDKWGRSTSWRGEAEGEERSGPPERGGRQNWSESGRGAPPSSRKSWDNEDHLPEWANENPLESGGSFDDRGAFHGSDDEQLEGKGSSKKEGLQKSTSQQHISQKNHPPLFSSKSTISLVQEPDVNKHNIEESILSSKNSEVPSDSSSPDEDHHPPLLLNTTDKILKEPPGNTNRIRAKSEGPPFKHIEDQQHTVPRTTENKVEDTEFEKLHEDFVLKLVGVEEESGPVKQSQSHTGFEAANLPPPPNLAVPGQDKWFYQDPQGQMQGPFTNMEMLEWFKAGYFGLDLKVRRQCDERFLLLGELIALCGSSNPFQINSRFPVLKHDISKMPLQYQFLSQLATYKQAPSRVVPDPWSAISMQQHELAAQRLIMQQQQAQQDMQYLQQTPAANPLMHMINQMQQANKLPPAGLLDKQSPNMPGAIDPHVHMQMTNFLSLQNRLPVVMPNQMPSGLPGPVPGPPIPPESIAGSLPGLQGPAMGTPGMPIPGIPAGLAGNLGLNVPRAGSVDRSAGQDSDPITSLLKQLQQKQTQAESLWSQKPFVPNNVVPPPHQWPAPGHEQPLSMWDMQQPSPEPTQSSQQPEQNPPESSPKKQSDPSHNAEKEKSKKADKNKETKHKDEEKEQKKKKKAEEEQLKKEADEKRKQEQRRLEAEKKAEAEKKRKEEERIKRELEKAKKDAEEKRQRELEEKRKLKEQRKLEEEARKKMEEMRRIEEERIQKEMEQREREERQKAEERRLEQLSLAKSAPWSQSNSSLGLSLAEIQKAEKEKKAQEVASQAKRAQLEKEMKIHQQQQLEKAGNLQLGWAKKPLEPRKVKSLAEIQAEEQERLAKEATEARLKKEKEARENSHQVPTANSIWSGQSLTWASASSAHTHWSSTSNISGFWEEPPQKQPQPTKPSTVAKSSSMSTINNSSKQAAAPKQQKAKTKREETGSKKNNHNNNIDDEFTNWCYKALENLSSNIDVPTFVNFLRDIESAFEVREYCKEYLGENNSTYQFANSFLEKRRSFKSRESQKDDMCSPAPAITPAHHNTEFQEVKGKNKKSKKSKMLKVDSRILGFNVTSAPDRINVGDRDYGDNS
ncbi:GIGYF family protein CG11148 isoform X2 [Sitophilus oryzae]|nr:GIGYF family protein CG11148 isoform X2 [Sitophilus oryzae]